MLVVHQTCAEQQPVQRVPLPFQETGETHEQFRRFVFPRRGKEIL